MTDPNAPSNHPDVDASSEGADEADRTSDVEAAASRPGGSPSSVPPPSSSRGAAEAPTDPLESARAEAGKLRDQLLRTAADFDNFRKRARREQEDATRRGKEVVLKELLPVFDNLERAAGHADKAPDIASVAEGLRMVLKQFQDTLGKMGVERVESVGKPFDPSVHEAIQHMFSAEHPAGTVAAEVQPGYRFGDFLVRAALVVVSKGADEGQDGAPSGEA